MHAEGTRRFPFPLPNGWFAVAESDALRPGDVLRAFYLGRELVIFRGASGSAHVFDAYCPHLGAHLAVGGRVVGDTLQCPFHGWRFDADPAIAAAVTPRPLIASPRGEVSVTFSHVAMHIRPGLTIEIGSAVFGVRASYDGVEGTYLLTMPMTAEQAVLGGRDTFGEPKKLARIEFDRDGDAVSARSLRMGIPYLEVRGSLRESLPARAFSEYGYCYKALPSCEQAGGFDGDPLLVRLEWKHTHRVVNRVDGELILRESVFQERQQPLARHAAQHAAVALARALWRPTFSRPRATGRPSSRRSVRPASHPRSTTCGAGPSRPAASSR